MTMSSPKVVLIFGVGLVIGLSLFHLNTKSNENLSDDYWPPQHNTVVNETAAFDYFLFVLQWPAAFCNIQRNNPKLNNCNPDPPLKKHRDNFTVHGLWPQLNGAKSPLFCSPAPGMTNNDFVGLEDDLLAYWPNLHDAKNVPPVQNFWTWEWHKHGKCSSKKFKPREYIQKTINLAKKHRERIFNELKSQGITPDGRTARREEKIKEVVKKATGYNPMISIHLNYLGDHLLSEIKLCVQKDGETLFDCDPHYKFAAPKID